MKTALPRGLVPAVVALLAAGGFSAWSGENGEFIFYLAVMVLLVGLMFLVHRRVGLHALTLWGLAGWLAAHLAGGLWPVDGFGVLYNWRPSPDLPKYDQLVHAYGFGLCTWIWWQVLQRVAPGTPASFGMLFLCGAAAMGLGALNEVVEFAATLLIPETNVGGYLNTGWDLVSNGVGCVLAALLIAWRVRRPGGA